MTAPIEHALELATGGNKVFPCGPDMLAKVEADVVYREMVREREASV
jgi:hypothetical protein